MDVLFLRGRRNAHPLLGGVKSVQLRPFTVTLRIGAAVRMPQPDQNGPRTLALGHLDRGVIRPAAAWLSSVIETVTVIGWSALHHDLFPVREPRAGSRHPENQRPVITLVHQHVAEQFEPRAVGRGRAEILAVCPAVLDRLEDEWLKALAM